LWLLLALLVPSVVSAGAAVELSPPEARYVAESGPVTLCVDPDWPPFETIDAGRHVGIAADLLGLVAERTGLRFTLVPTASWDESLEASRQGRCRALSFLNRTPQREQWLLFTRPLLSDVNVFITREEHPFIADPGRLAGETIVFPSGTAMEELIRRDYPNLKILTTASEDEAIAMVSDRKADMTMRSLIVAAYTIKKRGLFNLKIAGQLPYYSNNLGVGVVGDDRMLVDILNKGIDTITTAERAAIENRHVSINVQTVTDYGALAKVLGAVLALAALGGVWAIKVKRLNTALRREIERREELERMRADVEQIIRHDLVTPLSGLIGIPELLETEANLTPQQRELLRHAATSGRRMLATIRMAGDLARMEKGTYNVVKADCDVLGRTPICWATCSRICSKTRPRLRPRAGRSRWTSGYPTGRSPCATRGGLTRRSWTPFSRSTSPGARPSGPGLAPIRPGSSPGPTAATRHWTSTNRIRSRCGSCCRA
jgi:ABC-type amino acid transport substrate-binding protein